MKKCLVLLGVAALAVLLTTSAFAGNRGVSFTSIGFIDPPGQYPASQVWDMNPAGTVFVTSPSFSGSYITLWTREAGWQTLVGSGTPSSAPLTNAGTLMSNGIYPGSNPAYLWPGLWLGATDMWSPLPAQAGYAPCGSSRISFYDMGGEGDFATGLTWQGCAIARAFKWDKATNTTIDLGSPNTRSTRGNAITTDGSAVYGWGTALFGTRRGAKFANGTVTFLGDPNGLEPKACRDTGKACTVTSADPVTGCPVEYVDDGSCPTSSKGTCTGGVCVGGFDAGKTCTNSSQCGGYLRRRAEQRPALHLQLELPGHPGLPAEPALDATTSSRARRTTARRTAATPSAGTSTTAEVEQRLPDEPGRQLQRDAAGPRV